MKHKYFCCSTMSSFLTIMYKNIFGYYIYQKESKKRLPNKIDKILFICKGNICRSAMAEYISRKKTGNLGISDLEFYSRGLDVQVKNSSPSHAILVCQLNGIDLSHHKSTMVDKDIIHEADLILTMEYRQSRILLKHFPGISHKVFLLPRFYNRRYTGQYSIIIRDPYGRSISEFHKCYSHIAQCLNNLYCEIKKVCITENNA